MTAIVSIDGAGRIVRPKPLRDQLDLHSGSQLELAAREDRLELRPLASGAALRKQDGLWIHHGKTSVPLAAAVQRLRDERADQLVRQAVRPKQPAP